MNRSRVVSAFLVMAALAMFAVPAAAQQASAYSNPLDSASDTQAWYIYDDYGYWATDSNPIDGHDGGSSLNMNDSSGTLNSLYYNYFYFETDLIDIAGLQNAVVSFWCIADLPSYASNWVDRAIYIYDNNWNYYQYWSMGESGYGFQLECTSDWHEHQLAIPPELVGMGAMRIQQYGQFENYTGESNLQGLFFDQLNILVPDVTPPDAIIDLDADNATLTEIELSWTSPIDDDVSGVAGSFDLRMSTSPITVGNFANATQLNGEPNPAAPGTLHTVLITNLDMDTTYYFAVQSTDIAGNPSALSNVATLSTLAPPPPPPQGGNTTGKTEKVDLRADDVLPCSAGSAAAPTGLLALAGLMAIGFALRRKA